MYSAEGIREGFCCKRQRARQPPVLNGDAVLKGDFLTVSVFIKERVTAEPVSGIFCEVKEMNTFCCRGGEV